MKARWFLLAIFDEHHVLEHEGACVAVLFLDDDKREKFKRWKEGYAFASASLPDLNAIEVVDELSVEWFTEVKFTGPYTKENDDESILDELGQNLVLEFSNGELGTLGKKMGIELMRAIVSDDGIFWAGHRGAEITTAATLSWEELLEDKPLSPH